MAAGLVLSVTTNAASAQTKDECFAATVEAQQQERAGDWLLAQRSYMRCASASCPIEVSAQCTEWLSALAPRIPTAVPFATSAEGEDVADFQLTIDGVPVAGAGAGQSILINPGAHRLVFQWQGQQVIMNVVMREGDKARPLRVRFAPVAPPPSPSASPSVPPGLWAVGAIGAAGATVFAVAGSIGIAQWSDCEPGCDHNDQVRTTFYVADTGLAVGVVGLAIALVWYLALPSPSDDGQALLLPQIVF